MAAHRKESPRTETMSLRLTTVEKALVGERALAAGLKVSDYVRFRVLGEPTAIAGTPPAPPAATVPVTAVEEDGALRRNPVDPVEIAVKVEVEAEVNEALKDDPTARALFVERRAKVLHGQGATMIQARMAAAREWAER